MPRPPRARWSQLTLLGLAALLLTSPLTAPDVARAEDPTPTGDTVVGELVQAYADPGPEAGDPHDEGGEHTHDEEGAGLLSWVRPEDGDAVRVPTEDVDHLPTGATLEVVVGAAVRDEAAVEGLEPARDVLAAEVVAPAETAAAAGGPVNHPVTVVMVQPADAAAQRAADPTTLADVISAVDTGVADFWDTQSAGEVRFGVTASHDWITTTATCEDPIGIWQAAANAVDWQGDWGEHLLVYVPADSPGCSYGLGSVGTSIDDGGAAYVRDTETSVIAHEFGHNLGLGHSSAVQCDRTVEGGTCRRLAYGDLYDVMGVSWSQVGTLNAIQSELLGFWQDERLRTSVWNAETVVSLGPVAAGVDGSWRAVELTDPYRGGSWWLEYRQASGQDGWLGTGADRYGLQQGVVLRRAADGDDTSLLLDGTPSPRAGWPTDGAVALPVGTPVSLGGGLFTVTVQGVSAGAATVRVVPLSPIAAAYAAAGGASGEFGPERFPGTCESDGPHCLTLYRDGALSWTPGGGVLPVVSPVYRAWEDAGGAGGPMGYPVSSRYPTANGGWTQPFEGGRVHWSPATGAHAVMQPFSALYDALSGEAGVLGYPVYSRYPTADGGVTQPFQNGRIHWSPDTGAQVVLAPISGAYDALSGEAGVLGYPVYSRYPTANGGWTQPFQNGRIHWSPATGAHAVFAPISPLYDALSGEAGVLGYPVYSQYPTANGGWTQPFQNGRIHWSPATNAQVVLAPISGAYDALSGESGVLGYPVYSRYATVNGGWTQPFQAGRIHWSPATGAFAVYGELSRAYDVVGGEAGVLGYPVGSRYPTARGGWTQPFQNGRIHFLPSVGAYAVSGAFSRAYDAQGGEGGRLGYPVGLQFASVRGGARQDFQRGALLIASDGRVSIIDR